jgi:hippurate hydrolase
MTKTQTADKMADIFNDFGPIAELATEWRRTLHALPELGFDLPKTSAFVIEKLKGFGVDQLETGIAETGIVARIHGKQGPGPTIGLRADMDALPIVEKSGLEWASRTPGRMHGCGHDGHTAMLLGAAKWLAASRDFAGTVALIFQPAEEVELPSGGLKMVQDGFLDRYDISRVYALHNKPGIDIGHFACRIGALMGSQDDFDIEIRGAGGHAAYPHRSVDPVVIAAQIILGLQGIASRKTDPLASVVVSVTKMKGSEGYNIISDTALLSGTVRALGQDIQDMAERELSNIAQGIASAFGAGAIVTYRRSVPVTANSAEDHAIAVRAASGVVPMSDIETAVMPGMGAEDFAYMLAVRPGAMMFIGNGPTAALHSPHYDFNDKALIYGIAYWVSLTQQVLAPTPQCRASSQTLHERP